MISILQMTKNWVQLQSTNSTTKLVGHFLDSIDSTNTFAKNLPFPANKNSTDADVTSETHLVVANFQTQGKGRGTHHWDSSPDSNFLSSWCTQIPNDVVLNPVFSCRVGLALYRALQSTWPWVDFNLKAPNDIYIHDKKLAGLLIELTQSENVKIIVGLGLNVLQAPSQYPAISLSQALSKDKSTTEILKNSPEKSSSKNNSEYLSKNLTESLSEYLPESWHLFLSHWYFEWQQLFALNSSNTSHRDAGNIGTNITYSKLSDPLSAFECRYLLQALNRHPLLNEKYISIKPDGSLITSSGEIHWSML